MTSNLENLLYALFFIIPIILILSIIGGNFLISTSFSSIERILKRLELSFEKVSQFSSDASHELKTPLTIIRGELEIGLRKDRTKEEYKNILKTCLDEILIIKETINDLLFLAKSEQHLKYMQIQSIYLDELIEESILEVKNYANLKTILLINNIDNPITIKAYSSLLKIAIKNILKNSIQFSHKDSNVIIRSKTIPNYFIIQVQDYGIGISKKEQIKIFYKFYRTDKSRNKNLGGTGLGMPISKKILDIHDAEIFIKSEENEGTIVSIHFNLEKQNI